MDLLPSCSHQAHTTIKVISAIGEESRLPSTVENDGDARSPTGVSSIADGTVGERL
jgi:hypothetical protein